MLRYQGNRVQRQGPELMWLTVLVAIISSLSASAFKLSPDKNQNEVIKGNMHETRAAESSASGSLEFKDHTPAGIMRIREGQQFTFECRAGGDRPTIHFLKDGQRVIQGTDNDVLDEEASYEDLAENRLSKSMYLSNTKARLILDCVTARHAGVYTCVAETPYEKITTTTTLKVVPLKSRSHSRRQLHRLLRGRKTGHYSETSGANSGDSCMRKRTPSGGVPGRIHMWTDLRLQFEGNSVQLFCRAGGTPTPIITWYDSDGRALSNDDSQYTILKNGDLLIRSIAFYKNMGNYRCVAENPVGRDAVEMFLYPVGPEER